MRKVPAILAFGAAVGGATSMILVATTPRNAFAVPIFVIGMIITLGALSSAKRLARQSRTSL